jgi:hypothetical protein
MAGAAWFDSKLDLDHEASLGIRFGMAAGPRFTVLMDVMETEPARKTTGASSRVLSLRALGQFRLLTGAVRPYLIGGFGGVLFDFDDANDTAGATLRRAADNSVYPSANVNAIELGSGHHASARTDPVGRFQLIVRPDVGYDLRIDLPSPNQPSTFYIPNVSSTADSTFDLVIDAPAP